MLLSPDLPSTNSWQSLFWAAKKPKLTRILWFLILQIPYDMIAWLWLVVAMGSDSSHGVHHCPEKSRLETPWLSWEKHVDIADIADIAESRPWIPPRRRRCTACDSPSPRARGMTRGSWDGGWLMAKARRCSSDTWPNWRPRGGKRRINRRRTRRDPGCWRPLRTLMRYKQQRSLRWSRWRRRESGFEKDLVGINHDWVSKWPSTSTSSTIWREFHPQKKFSNYPKKVVGVDAVHGHREMSSFGIAYIETLRLWMQHLRILQALSFFLQVAEFEASPGSEVAEAGAVFEQGLSKQSRVVLRSGRVQHGSTWFSDILHPHHCRSCCHWVSLKHNALDCVAAANGQSEAMKH